MSRGSAVLRRTVSAAVVILSAVAAVMAGTDRCGPYLRDFYCGVACSQSNGFTGPVVGRLTCACVPAPTALLPEHRNCNTHLPQAYGPGVPAFHTAADGDTLEEFTLSGFKEISRVQSGAFLNVGCRLTVLRLTRNAISSLEPQAFAGLVALRLLNLSGNSLGDGDRAVVAVPRGADTPNLEVLDLSYNDISSLGLADFSTLTKLRRLEFHHNRILTIADASSPPPLSAPRGLRELSMGGGAYYGRIAECDFYVLCRALNLTALSLAGTSWRCNCDIVWLRLAYNTCAVVDSMADVECLDTESRRRRRATGADDYLRIPISEYNTSACEPALDPAAEAAAAVPQRCEVAFSNETSTGNCTVTAAATTSRSQLGTTARPSRPPRRRTTAHTDERIQQCLGSAASWSWSVIAGCACAQAVAQACFWRSHALPSVRQSLLRRAVPPCRRHRHRRASGSESGERATESSPAAEAEMLGRSLAPAAVSG